LFFEREKMLTNVENLTNSQAKVKLNRDVVLSQGDKSDPLYLPAGISAVVQGRTLDVCFLSDGNLRVGIEVLTSSSAGTVIVPVDALKFVP